MVGAEWIDRTEYPFESKWFDVGKKRMHYIDEGTGMPIVFLHDTPGWSFEFRHLIKGLRNQFRCIAIDYVGFGLSDKPTEWTYRPDRQAEYFADFIDGLNLPEFSMVVHGIGGPIGLSYALQRPSQVSHLVLINTFMWPLNQNQNAKKVDKLVNGPLGRTAYLSANYAVRKMCSEIKERQFFNRTVQSHYKEPLDEAATRVGPYGYAKALLGSSGWFQALWDQREVLATIPSEIIWGMQDKLLTDLDLSRWQMLLPEAPVKKLKNLGHYLVEEMGPGLGPAIEMFVTDTEYLPTATLM